MAYSEEVRYADCRTHFITDADYSEDEDFDPDLIVNVVHPSIVDGNYISFTEYREYLVDYFKELEPNAIAVWDGYNFRPNEEFHVKEGWFYNDLFPIREVNNEPLLYRISSDDGLLKRFTSIYVWSSLHGWEPFLEYNNIFDFIKYFHRDNMRYLLYEGYFPIGEYPEFMWRMEIEHGFRPPENDAEKDLFKQKVFTYFERGTEDFNKYERSKLGSFIPSYGYEINCDGNRKYWPSGKIRVGGGREPKRGYNTFLGLIEGDGGPRAGAGEVEVEIGGKVKMEYGMRRPMGWDVAKEIYQMSAYMGPREISTLLFGVALDDLTENELAEFWEIYNYGDSAGIRLISGAIYADAVIGAPRAREQFLEIKGLIQRENDERQRREAELNQDEDDGLYIVISEDKEMGTEAERLEDKSNVILITGKD